MEDFEVHPVGTAERIKRLEQELAMHRSMYPSNQPENLRPLPPTATGVGIKTDW